MAKATQRHDKWMVRDTGNASHSARRSSFTHKRSGDSVGLRYDSFLEAAELVVGGIDVSAVDRLHKTSGLTLERIKQVAGISEGSLSRRKQTGRLSQQESERLLRISRIFEKAAGLFEGSAADALEWLETPLPVLGNERPLDLSRSEPGAREVEDLIGRIENGVVS